MKKSIIFNLQVTGKNKSYPSIYCPACESLHVFDERWDFNGNYEQPTFFPSMKVTRPGDNSICHSIVRGGKIKFLSDCTHTMKNLTVDLEPYKQDGED